MLAVKYSILLFITMVYSIFITLSKWDCILLIVTEMLSLLETTCSFIVTGSSLDHFFLLTGLVAYIYSCLSIAGIFGVKWRMSPMKHP